ncbi:hypothetical protein GY21_08755 [Cryobacterium roopkundense]|uniref:Uncharacterized protein n=1 Tax=Cryobacterium roopkundense TaxID=1001240 RepID=A0A099JHF1_9MICO|nr:hypothetical protein GY21_08755 [Cryobacterium roopkundense]MBB5643161.1 hypothetical protein [Cryobacterium roopkundense]
MFDQTSLSRSMLGSDNPCPLGCILQPKLLIDGWCLTSVRSALLPGCEQLSYVGDTHEAGR